MEETENNLKSLAFLLAVLNLWILLVNCYVTINSFIIITLNFLAQFDIFFDPYTGKKNYVFDH